MPILIRRPSEADRAAAEQWPLWTCEPSVFEWGYAATEHCLMLEGEAMVEARGKEFRFKAGDYVSFPKGLACRWHVLSAVKKRYTFED